MPLVLSLLLFVAAIAYVEWRLKSVNRSNDEADKRADDYFATKKALKEHIDRTVKQRESDLQTLDDRIASIEQRVFFQQAQASPATAAAPQQTPPKDVFFLRWPADDGTFDDAAREPSASENTYYEFRLLSPTEAEFRFTTISDTQLSKANNSSKKYIERACTFTTTKSAHYSCQPGRAVLQQGRWRVTQKAVITYS